MDMLLNVTNGQNRAKRHKMTKDDQNIAVLEQISESDQDNKEFNDNPQYPDLRTLNSFQKNQIVFNALRDLGLSIHKSGMLAGYKSKRPYEIDKRRKAWKIESLLPVAKKALKNTIKGVKTGNAENPKTSDVLTGAKMVMDRVFPIIQRVDQRSISVHMEISADERREYLESMGMVPGGEE